MKRILLSAGLVLGLLKPVAAWRWALLLVLGLPVVTGCGHFLGVHTDEPIRLDPRVWLLSLAVGLLGYYTGVATGSIFIEQMKRAKGPTLPN